MKYKDFGFAARFKELRCKDSLTQSDAAEVFKVKQSTVSGWETGFSLPPLEKAVEIAAYFRVSLDYLVGTVNFKL